jgi:hypothetical protein
MNASFFRIRSAETEFDQLASSPRLTSPDRREVARRTAVDAALFEPVSVVDRIDDLALVGASGPREDPPEADAVCIRILADRLADQAHVVVGYLVVVVHEGDEIALGPLDQLVPLRADLLPAVVGGREDLDLVLKAEALRLAPEVREERLEQPLPALEGGDENREFHGVPFFLAWSAAHAAFPSAICFRAKVIASRTTAPSQTDSRFR